MFYHSVGVHGVVCLVRQWFGGQVLWWRSSTLARPITRDEVCARLRGSHFAPVQARSRESRPQGAFRACERWMGCILKSSETEKRAKMCRV